MRIQIDPLDTLFFRDARPFAAGADTWANSIFPPLPSVVYGALRTAWFAHNGFDPSKVNTNVLDDPTMNLRITGMAIMEGTSCNFPIPLDLAAIKGENKLISLFLQQAPVGSSTPCEFVLTGPEGKQVENQPGFLDEGNLARYLSPSPHSKNPSYVFKKPSSFMITEQKTGIKRNRITHTAEDSMLYRVGMLRLCGLPNIKGDWFPPSLIVDFEGLTFPVDSGFLKLGGEGKGAAFKVIDEKKISAPAIAGSRVRLYLSTPAVFKNGWLPGCLVDGISVNGEKIRFKLLAAAVGKTVPVSGFDMKERRPKPLRWGVPAGSVYHLEIVEGTSENVVAHFHGKSVAELGYDREGFGLAFIGKGL